MLKQKARQQTPAYDARRRLCAFGVGARDIEFGPLSATIGSNGGPVTYTRHVECEDRRRGDLISPRRASHEGRMVRATRADQLLFLHRRRRPGHAPTTVNVLIMREELQQFGGEEPEDQDPRICGGGGHRRRRRDDDRSAVIGKATERISSTKWHALVSANLRLLLGLIQIYQNRKVALFETRPATMAISLAVLCISVFAPAALLKFKAVKAEEEEQTARHFLYCRVIHDMNVLISGVVTLSCHVSVFVADGLVWIVFVSCACIVSALPVA
ncbi:hypothetical protein RHMOL_Rhmol01G0119100 [Rhododendron molle]|uniref:Uncharacterized protein n=1 Tax=Rhododendron molle TaxID=49168 RepID=A0ACC0Q361_RHOML|nr:hypothetical protein RHMOL_Rhmol01G0119100 [Rhododendron molle]